MSTLEVKRQYYMDEELRGIHLKYPLFSRKVTPFKEALSKLNFNWKQLKRH
jgi:hypothetical protein